MAYGRPIDVNDAERIEVPFRYNRSVPPGSRVFVHYSIDGGSWETDELTISGSSFDGIVEMPEGGRFEFKFKIVDPAGKEKWYPEGGTETNLKGVARKGTERSPSPTHSTEEVQHTFKARVKDTLEASLSHGTAKGLEALFQDFAHDIDSMGIKDDMTKRFLVVVAEAIVEMTGVSASVKALFKKENPVRDLADFEQRIKRGSEVYRRKVFEALRKNEEACKALGIKNGVAYNASNPLGGDKLNKLFDRICSQRDLGHLVAGIGNAYKSVVDVPARNPSLAAARTALFDKVAERIKPEEKKFLDKVPSGRLGASIDTAFQVGLLATAGPVAGYGLSLTKAGLETGIGFRLKDIVAALREDPSGKRHTDVLWKMFKENNIISRIFTAPEGKGWTEFKSALKDTFAQSIFASPFWYKGSKTGENTVGTAATDTKGAEELINKASEEALS